MHHGQSNLVVTGRSTPRGRSAPRSSTNRVRCWREMTFATRPILLGSSRIRVWW